MTRFCGWLIILDVHWHPLQYTCMDHRHNCRCIYHKAHTSKLCIDAHTHPHNHSTPCLSSLNHVHPNPALFTKTHCLQYLLQAPFSHSGTVHSPHSVTHTHTQRWNCLVHFLFKWNKCKRIPKTQQKTGIRYRTSFYTGDPPPTLRCHPGCPDALPTCARPHHKSFTQIWILSLHKAALQEWLCTLICCCMRRLHCIVSVYSGIQAY